MKLKIFQIGKTKREYSELCDEFLKRLGKFASMEVREVKEENLLGLIAKEQFVVLLDEKGRELDSLEFADFMEKKKDMGVHVTFVIGGAFGLSDEIKAACDYRFGLSRLTFTHQMAKVLLLEQIFRAFCIINKKEYHY